jgi:hypothetical protein
VMTGDGTPRRSERTSGRERVDYRESSMECDTQSDSDEEENSEPLSYRLKLHAADPRYMTNSVCFITNSEDCNRGDVIHTGPPCSALWQTSKSGQQRRRMTVFLARTLQSGD